MDDDADGGTHGPEARDDAGQRDPDDDDPEAPVGGGPIGGGPASPSKPAPAPGPHGPDTPTSAAHFFLPTPEPDNTAAPVVEVDAQGGVHAVYPAYAGGDAYYAYCARGCASAEDVEVVHFETEGSVANAMLALDAQGRPRILLSTFQKVYFGACDQGCTERGSWKYGEILDHKGDRQVSGQAFALDPQGRPRFVMHTYLALFGIGQKPPATFLAQCDAACEAPQSWRIDQIQDQIWQSSSLRFDDNGGAHLATVAVTLGQGGPTSKLSAYLKCDSGCTSAADWHGIGFVETFEQLTAAAPIAPAVSLALTKQGAPRVLVLGKTPENTPNIVYLECDQNCAEDNWRGSTITSHADIGPGIDLALDAQDRPRFVYTLNYNIGLAYCDDADCTHEEALWDGTKVELSGEMDPDDIFLWDNCTVGAWFLHSPSLALTKEGAPRVGYQARDISGGLSQPDPTKPRCEAGTDMTWSRLASLPSYR